MTLGELKDYRDKLHAAFHVKKNKATTSRWRALDLLGGREVVCRNILDAARAAQMRAGLSDDEISLILGFPDSQTLELLEETPDLLTTANALALLTNLSLPIDRVLPLPPIAHSDIQQWRLYMRNFTVQAILASGDPIGLAGDTALVVFIRLQALKELDEHDIANATA